jgi:thiamine biosynthesis protein ThiS
MTTAITIVVNGESRGIPEGLKVSALLVQLGFKPERVAIERNLNVLPRALWDVTQVQSGDRFEIVHFVGGG